MCIRYHLDGLELAAFHAILAAFAFISIHHCQEPVGGHQVVTPGTGNGEEVFAAAVATITVAPVHQAGVFRFQGYVNSFSQRYLLE